MMRILPVAFLFFLLLFCPFVYGQQKFKVVVKETGAWPDTYSLVDEKGKQIRQLDTATYYICFTTDQYVSFAIFGMKGKRGWVAINAAEKVLFSVYNTSFGEPSPDYLVENKIRIVDENNRIGFANSRGEVVIQPQFEIASSFYKGKAIIGQQCKKLPWDKHAKESDCQHFSIVCRRHGYINEKGTIVKLGSATFEQVMNEIGWKAPDE